MMKFCTECGAKIPEGKKFCPECGTPVGVQVASPQETVPTVPVAVAAPPVQAPAQAVATPYAQAPVHTAPPTTPVQTAPALQTLPASTGEQSPPSGSPYAVMGTGGFFGSAILMGIPIIGWIVCIIWACGGCKNLNRRNFARSTLIFLIIGMVFSFAMYGLINWLFGNFTNLITAWTMLS